MKNKYEICGDITVIFLRRKDGSTFEALIDTECLDKAMEITGRLYANHDKNTFYVRGYFGKPIMAKVELHRFLTNAPKRISC